MLALGLVFTACDLFEPGTGIGGGIPQETWEDLVVTGEDSEGKLVRIEFSRPAAKLALTLLTPSTLKDNDNYRIWHDNKLVSSGTIKVNGSTITFIPQTPASGNQFQATLTASGGVPSLNLPDGVVPSSTGGTITGFHITTGGGGVDNTAALAVAALLNSSNAVVDKGNVMIKGPVIVTKNIPVPANVKLIFNTRDDDEFKINRNVSVTLKGGIEVSSGNGVTVTGEGSLVLEGNSTVIRGKLNIGPGTTLDITGNAIVESGGILSLAGEETVDKTFNAKYSQSIRISGLDAVLKMSGTLAVKNGGRFQLPDPFQFDLTNIIGRIEIEAGGELILLTAEFGGTPTSPAAEPFLYPLIGTVGTKTTGFPIGADFVMDPALAESVPSRIAVKVNSGVPALELVTGSRATALGRLILDKYLDSRNPPYRLEVFVNYPFTVAENSVLQVGNSKDYNLHSSLMVTGPDFYNYKSGLKSGVLTNNGKILVFENSGVVECFGGYFSHNNKVYEYKTGSDSASNTLIEMTANDGGVAISTSDAIFSLIKVWKNSIWNSPPWLSIF
jgi:hypothetical protein